jgi:hypothetical protein
MPAIVTDKIRLLNCSNFISDISTGSYYIFLGFPNATDFDSDWDNSQPSPIDNDLYLNSYRDTILGVKKVNSSDVIRVIPKLQWITGRKYDMYRHDYSVYNLSAVASATRLYDSQYYIINRDYRVYICLNNGSSPANQNQGVVSTQEPLHTDISPRKESDGYVWKYLYTLSPADVLKFDSTNYIAIPNDWTTTSNAEITRIRSNAFNGQIQTILIEKQAQYNYVGTLSGVPIKGDGFGGEASVIFDEESKPVSVEVTVGGLEYTYATLDLDSVLPPLSGEKAIFNVIIPPPGGHGSNPYTELGATRVLIYSRIENDPTNPDFIIGNQFSRIGLIKNIKTFGSNSNFTGSSGSGVYAAKMNTSVILDPVDSKITQTSSNGVGTLVSFDSTTQILKYIQPRTNYLDTYAVGNIITIDYQYANSSSGIQTATVYDQNEFDTSTNFVIGANSYPIDTSFNGSTITVGSVEYYLGQSFNSGLSSPDINNKSGEVLYVDNRGSVTRASQQREDIKIILEF